MAHSAIDIHIHIVPAEFPAYAGKHGGAWPHLAPAHDCHHKNVIIDGKNFRTVTDECWDVERRNAFCYFLGPEDLPVEYTAEMQQIDESYRAGTPDDWKWPPGRLDQWGISAKPSECMEAAGLKIRFTDDGYRLDEWR